jgi:hypothetical protein
MHGQRAPPKGQPEALPPRRHCGNTDSGIAVILNDGSQFMEDPKLISCRECGGTGKVRLRLDSLPTPSPPLEIDCPTARLAAAPG